MKQGKVWGSTEVVFVNDNFEVHRIQVKKNGYCSKHCHEYKHNMFYVESGELAIGVWKNEYELKDETIVTAGQKTSVRPNDYHQFQALEDTVAYEIYYTQPISGDIVRESVGGLFK